MQEVGVARRDITGLCSRFRAADPAPRGSDRSRDGCRRSRASSPPGRAPCPRARSRPRSARPPTTSSSSRSPTETQEKFAWLSVVSRPRSWSSDSTCIRSIAVCSTRRSSSSTWLSASVAAACASAFTEKGWRTRSTRQPELLRAERVAHPQPAEAVDLGEGAQQDQVRVPVEQRDRLVGVLERRELHVRLVDDHGDVARQLGHELVDRGRRQGGGASGCSGCRRSRSAWRR